MAEFKILSPLDHNKTVYNIGEIVDGDLFTPEDVAVLTREGVIAEYNGEDEAAPVRRGRSSKAAAAEAAAAAELAPETETLVPEAEAAPVTTPQIDV